MSSISSSSMQAYSPLQRLQNELASEVSAGTISSADQSALSSALSDIDASLKSQMDAGGPPPSGGTADSDEDDSTTSSLIVNYSA